MIVLLQVTIQKGRLFMPLSNTIKQIRKQAFMSQETFAKSLGVSVSTINRWENGKVKPNISDMKRIRDFCIENNVSFDNVERIWANKILEESL